jgi:hypothetical protein
MATKDEFFKALDEVRAAAVRAGNVIPNEDFPPGTRMRKVIDALVTRLPEQIDDIKATLQDPHKRTERKIIDPFTH